MVHDEAPAVLVLPKEQDVQPVERGAGLNVPAGHAKHDASEEAPGLGLYLPAGQSVHLVAPEGLYVPAGQIVKLLSEPVGQE